LHNIPVATNVYKIGMAARGGSRDEILGRMRLRPALFLDCEARGLRGKERQEVAVSSKAKLGQDGTSGGRRAREGATAPNKANFRRSDKRRKCFAERELW
jgi:hypothetical protein